MRDSTTHLSLNQSSSPALRQVHVWIWDLNVIQNCHNHDPTFSRRCEVVVGAVLASRPTNLFVSQLLSDY
jgi:hypothetical protein